MVGYLLKSFKPPNVFVRHHWPPFSIKRFEIKRLARPQRFRLQASSSHACTCRLHFILLANARGIRDNATNPTTFAERFAAFSINVVNFADVDT